MITAPASIAWLFNIRGGDVIRSPLPLGPGDPQRRRLGAAVPRSGQGDRRSAGLARQSGAAGNAGRRWQGALAELARPEGADRSRPIVGLVLRNPGAPPAPNRSRARRSLRPAPRLQERGGDRGNQAGPRPRRRGPHPLPALGGHRGPGKPAGRGRGGRQAGRLPRGDRRAEGSLASTPSPARPRTAPSSTIGRRHGSTSAPSAARCCWWIPAPSIWTAPPT